MDIEKQVRPLHDFVVVRRDDSDRVSIGGIVIPDTAQEKVTRGIVVAVGPGKRRTSDGARMEPSVKRGDRVLFGKYSGNEMQDKLRSLGGEFVAMREEEVLAVIDD